MMRARKRKGCGWKRWSRRWLYDTLGLFGRYRVHRPGRLTWKRTSGYYDQADAENAFSRFKRTFGDRLRAKQEESQEREASLACQLLNRMLECGRPQSYPVSEKRNPWGQCGV